MTKDNQYSLNNQENYNLKLTASISEIQTKYNHLLIEYILFILENVKIKDIIFLKFIMHRGLLTITNVFNIILFYTKNIDVAYFHSQKAFYFYVEFIGQISEDQHTFLQLSSRDATLFVYKKTIFYINSELKQTIHDKEEIQLLKKNEILQHIYQNLLELVSNIFDFSTKEEQSYHINKVGKIIQKIVHHYTFSYEDLDVLNLFISKIKQTSSKLSDETVYTIIHVFLKKYHLLISSDVKTVKNIKNNILRWNEEEINISILDRLISCL
uniref:Uncharacterized protein n=1 Tax=viral metagenome TaxID=1070528 RepID=A0A6C0BB24_9ZZZZ